MAVEKIKDPVHMARCKICGHKDEEKNFPKYEFDGTGRKTLICPECRSTWITRRDEDGTSRKVSAMTTFAVPKY